MALVVVHPASIEHQKNQGIRELPIAESSFLQHLKYDPANFQLTVTMKNGAQYIHWYVYPQIVEQFFESPSKGKFYADNIKGKHPSTKAIDKNVGRIDRKATI